MEIMQAILVSLITNTSEINSSKSVLGYACSLDEQQTSCLPPKPQQKEKTVEVLA